MRQHSFQPSEESLNVCKIRTRDFSLASAIQIVLVPDSAFVPFTVPGNRFRHRYLSFVPRRNALRRLIIAPHHREAWLNTGLLKIALYCRANDIELVAIGHENQLPFFGIFADAAILQEGPLEGLFGYYSSFCTDITGFSTLDGWEDVYDHDSPQWETAYCEYSNEDVVAAFGDCRIFIREESMRLFNSLRGNLPSNGLWCEVKMSFVTLRDRLNRLADEGLPIFGVEKLFQQSLVRDHGSHFMALQILSSLIGGNRFILAGGAAHVFSVVPVMTAICIGPGDRFFTLDTNEAVKHFNWSRFGLYPYIEKARTIAGVDTRRRNAVSWQGDFNLDDTFLRTFLRYILELQPTSNLTITPWSEYQKEPDFSDFCSTPLEFGRVGGRAIAEVVLSFDQRIRPRCANEHYWTCIGGLLRFRDEAAQLTGIFSFSEPRRVEGPFLYRKGVRHYLRRR